MSVLPICEFADAITAALQVHPVTIVCGDTGSGKTTQLPQLALHAGRGTHGMIGVTQPRRLAALAMARRVAEELGGTVGELVGCQHRFERKLSADTRIKFMTDGILLAETRTDRLFRAYDTLIIDEAHERSLNIDFILGIIKQILPHRPDLKVIIASATLDVSRFSEFFNDAPVISVPGRLYPIETRFRGVDAEDADLPRQIANAVDELSCEAPGDILVFLPGERDIREAATVLTGRRLPRTDILPLMASLTAAEQQRAFRTSANRRIILSTNVAETSVTIPGIRYVIDSGFVRLSRFNPRTHVRRLQIEPVSQASAKQRQGRCGRVAPGICIRLYDEDDFKSRDAYTPPEILRTSLAGVILTMLDLKLGSIETFPFIDPPPPAAIREGYRTLLLLGAVSHTDGVVRLTPLGRRLARLPLDPAPARMLLAAHDVQALAPALTIVAALACDDPRRRPMDKQAEADRCHAQFLSPVSDFCGLLRLWDWYHEQTKNKSQTLARKICKDHFLSFPRMRDWMDLREQLERLCITLHLDTSSVQGGDIGLHKALLTGLLQNIGKRDEEAGDWRGAHGVRYCIFPGSGLMKKEPKRPPAGTPPKRDPDALPESKDWVFAAELVETTRLFARTAATLDVRWIEPIAKDFCKYSHHSPAYDPASGFVRCKENVTLFGLPVVVNRLRDYSRVNPEDARAIFIREALVAGAFPKPVPRAVRENLARVEALLALEEKTRRHHAYVNLEDVIAFYDARVPADVCNANACRAWIRAMSDEEHHALFLRETDLPAAHDVSHEFPESVTVHGNVLPLVYRHAPGEKDDGITVRVPQALLAELGTWHSEWLVPGLLEEKLHAMLTILPVSVRRVLLPFDETLARVKHELATAGARPLADAFADAIYVARAIRVPREAWREETKLPTHLRLRFEVLDDATGAVVASSRDFSGLCALLGVVPASHDRAADVRDALGVAWQSYERTPSISRTLVAYLAERDITPEELGRDIGTAVLREVVLPETPRPDAATLTTLRPRLQAFHAARTRLTLAILEQARTCEALLADATIPVATLEDVEEQLAWLVFPGFAGALASERLAHYPRYLNGIRVRIERAVLNAAGDLKKNAEVAPVWQRYVTYMNTHTPSGDVAVALEQYRWLCEEFRISLFAQELKAACPVSRKRLDAAWPV